MSQRRSQTRFPTRWAEGVWDRVVGSLLGGSDPLGCVGVSGTGPEGLLERWRSDIPHEGLPIRGLRSCQMSVPATSINL